MENMTALQLGEKIRNGQIGVVEATKAFLACIEKEDSVYNCYNTVCAETALAQAQQVEAALRRGELSSPLAGVPMAVKDNLCTKGVLTTCSSKMLENFVPTYTAAAVARLEESGAVMLGKLNMDEFAMGSTCETSCRGPVRNPLDTSRVPGGSSGGAAAAVAANEAAYALGSDTGGSIRQPAAFCGITGLKPTYGRVSRRGLIAYASSLEQIGPLGKDAADVAAVFSLIAGHDAGDSTSARQPDFSFVPTGNMKGKKICLPTQCFGDGADAQVKAAVLAAAKVFEELGAVVEEVSVPELEFAVPAYYIIACAEAGSNLARYDGVKYGFSAKDAESLNELYIRSRSEGFGAEVQRRLLLGTFVLSSGYYDAYYKKALQVKGLIKAAFDRVFADYDMVLSPTSPTTAPKLGETLQDPLKMYMGDVYTVSANLAGLPALSLPCGFDAPGLPVGMQLMGKAFDEQTLLDAGYAFQQATSFHKMGKGGVGHGI